MTHFEQDLRGPSKGSNAAAVCLYDSTGLHRRSEATGRQLCDFFFVRDVGSLTQQQKKNKKGHDNSDLLLSSICISLVELSSRVGENIADKQQP
jgi:hypothetical protein